MNGGPAVPSGERTRAVIFPAPGEIATYDASLRAPTDDEVVVDTSYSSISAGTERLLFGGTLPGFPALRFPLVPGYEAAGVVVRTGADVREVRVGDEVFVGGSMCFTDVAGIFGGQAARLIKRADRVVPLRGMSLQAAPLLALAATALHGVRRLGDVSNARVLVLGMGAIGQFAARFLHAAGARVTCADVNSERLHIDVPVRALDASDANFEMVAGEFDAAIEATGRSGEIARCARSVRAGGAIALLSFYDELRAPYVDLFVKEVSLHVAREWTHDDLLAARDALASGDVGVGSLADYVVPAAEYERAYRTAFHDPSVSKVILQWV